MRLTLACAALLSCAPAAWAAEPLHFEMRPEAASSIQLRIERRADKGHQSNWSQTMRQDELPGLDRAVFDRGGQVAFHLTRPAGTLACSGSASDHRASGDCLVIADPPFADQLVSRGIGRPDQDGTFQLIMSGVPLDILDALRDEGWGRPTINQLVQLGIFHVASANIHALAKAGVRGGRIDDLIEFAIFKVTPDYVGQMRAAGVAGLSDQALVHLRIFKVTPADARAFARRGDAAPSASQLVELKTLGATPQDVRARD